MSRVRVVARNADGTDCVVIYPAVKERLDTRSDDEYFEEVCNQSVDLDPMLKGKPHVDVETDSLPPLEVMLKWRLADGHVTNAT